MEVGTSARQIPSGDYFGYKTHKQKSSTHIYNAPLPLPAPSPAPTAPPRPDGAPRVGCKGQSQGERGQSSAKCQHQGCVCCTAGSSEHPLTVGWEGGPQGGQCTPPLGRVDTTVLPEAGACSRKASFALGLGLSADGFHLKNISRVMSGPPPPQRPPKGAALLPRAPPRCPRAQRQGHTRDKGVVLAWGSIYNPPSKQPETKTHHVLFDLYKIIIIIIKITTIKGAGGPSLAVPHHGAVSRQR